MQLLQSCASRFCINRGGMRNAIPCCDCFWQHLIKCDKENRPVPSDNTFAEIGFVNSDYFRILSTAFEKDLAADYRSFVFTSLSSLAVDGLSHQKAGHQENFLCFASKVV